MSARQRLDQALVERGLFESREQARRAILAGRVRVRGQAARKASDPVCASDELAFTGVEKYVSRGGHKLEHALARFGLDVTGCRVVDVGASTGGFTDCLLQRGAARVHAVDVGRGQLAWKLRQDPRVVVREKTNARHLAPGDFAPGELPLDLAVVDCSFISLRHILPPLIALLRKPGRIVALVKPQFEAGKVEADRGAGVIREPAVRERVLTELATFVDSHGSMRWVGVCESPLLGPAGNKEYLALIETTG